MNTRRKDLAGITACVFILLLASATPVFAAASSQTTHQSFVQTAPDVNQCSGVPVTATFKGHTVLHITNRPKGSVSMSSTTTGTLTLVPIEDGQPTYSGHFTDLFSGTGFVDSATGQIDGRTMTTVHNVNLHGSDGSLILVHGVAHETINPDPPWKPLTTWPVMRKLYTALSSSRWIVPPTVSAWRLPTMVRGCRKGVRQTWDCPRCESALPNSEGFASLNADREVERGCMQHCPSASMVISWQVQNE